MKIIYKCENCGTELEDVYYFDLENKKNLCKNCFDFKIRERKLPLKEKAYTGVQRFKINFKKNYA